MIDFDNKNKIYICHFPGDTNILQERVQKEIKRKFFLDKKISVVCSFNSKLRKNATRYELSGLTDFATLL